MQTRREFLKKTSLTVASMSTMSMLISGCQKNLTKGSSEKKPNIVYILADDMGYGDVSSLNENGKINTKNIDSIANGGMTFTDAHSGSAVCTPTRYGVVTGRYSWRTHMKRGVLNGWSKPLIKPGRMTVASMLKENGYNTGCVGKWHLGWGWKLTNENADTEDWELDPKNVDFSKPITNGPTARGFDYYFGIPASLDMTPYVYVENDRATAVPDRTIDKAGGKAFWRKGPISPDFQHIDVLPTLTKKAVGFIERQSKDKPFFMYFPLTAPHKPIMPAKEFQGKSGLNEWGDFVMQVDWTVGQLLKALKRKGFEENTLVIFTSDNGATPGADFEYLGEHGHDPSYVFRGHKADIFEGGHRIPFVAKWPAKIKPGSTSEETVCLTDLMATAADTANYDLPDNAGEDSVSMLPALIGEKYIKPLREATVHHSAHGYFSIRKDKWKLILGPGSGGWSYPREDRPADIKGFPPVQLYDLEKDIEEKNNLYDKYPEKVKELTDLLQSYVDAGRSTPGKKQQNEGATPITRDK